MRTACANAEPAMLNKIADSTTANLNTDVICITSLMLCGVVRIHWFRHCHGIPGVCGPYLASSLQRMTKAHGGTILLVEDEELLRSAISTMLRHNYYSVLEAGDGTIAVELLRQCPDKIDLVLLDATLPGLSSRDVL